MNVPATWITSWTPRSAVEQAILKAEGKWFSGVSKTVIFPEALAIPRICFWLYLCECVTHSCRLTNTAMNGVHALRKEGFP